MNMLGILGFVLISLFLKYIKTCKTQLCNFSKDFIRQKKAIFKKSGEQQSFF